MDTIKNIGFTYGEKCEVNIDSVESFLAKLPIELYLELYHKMQIRLYGYPSFVGCCGTIGETKQELKAEIDYSALDETMEKVEEINAAAEKFKDLIEELQHKHVPIYIDVVEKYRKKPVG